MSLRFSDLPLGDPATHFWLTRSVARAMGLNLSTAMATGLLSAQDYCRMVTSCRQCKAVAACQHWLGSQAVPQGAALDSCRNKDQLERLRQGQSGAPVRH